MKSLSTYILLFCIHAFLPVSAQEIIWEDAKLNTAKSTKYMLPDEREMIYEINRLRSDPPRYAKSFITIRLKKALQYLEQEGKGDSSYSITTSYTGNTVSGIDTTWNFSNEEEVHALQTLYDTLLHLKPLSILLPDEGTYKACIKHAKDQAPTGKINHMGTDSTWPWERIKEFSPSMIDGNENIAFNGDAPVRSIVLLLLIDSGIPGYGHRYNMLESKWAYASCYATREPLMDSKWWIQEFARKK